MEIYLLRHGIAEDQKPGGRDADRALTGEGKKKLREVLAVAKAAGVSPDVILTSPYRRAKETAEIAREVLAGSLTVIPGTAFTPGGEMRDAWADIRGHRDAKAVMVATHEPFAGLFAAFLLNAPGMQVDFKKGAIMRIDVDSYGPQPRGLLKWMLTPRLAGAS